MDKDGKTSSSSSSSSSSGGASPTFSLEPVGAILGSSASIFDTIGDLIQGGRDKKMQEAQLAGAASANQINAILSLSQQKQAAEANRQRNNLIIGVVVLVVAGVAAFFIIRTNKRKSA